MKLQLFNVDSITEEIPEANWGAAELDTCVAGLAFKNFDGIPRRLPFLIECSTRSRTLWRGLLNSAQSRFWLRDESEGVAVFSANEHCGCVRTYRFIGKPSASREDHVWEFLPNSHAFYNVQNTPGAQAIFDAWHYWTNQATERATLLADGRLANTAVRRSLIVASPQGCVVCGSPATAHANTTLQFVNASALLIQVPLCEADLEVARQEPNLLTFFAKIFSLSLALPELVHKDAVPDELIPAIHEYVACGLGGIPAALEKRKRGWELKVALARGWHWHLRLNTLTDYAYMLFKPGEVKAVYRADAAPHHPDLPFFPHHEHSRPDQKRDVQAPSFLYGLPLLDLKRLRNIGNQLGCGE